MGKRMIWPIQVPKCQSLAKKSRQEKETFEGTSVASLFILINAMLPQGNSADEWLLTLQSNVCGNIEPESPQT